MSKWGARDKLNYPKLILCEGPTDEAFLRALAKHHNLAECCIRHVAEGNSDGAGGKDRIKDFLIGIPAWDGFFDLTDILVVVDADGVPADSFASAVDHIQQAQGAHTYPLPTAPGVKVAGSPSMTVLLVPWDDEPGNLETLCYPAARDAAGAANAAHLDAFATGTGVDAWPKASAQLEMKLRSLLALHAPDPFIGLGRVWTTGLVPLANPRFAKLAAALTAFLT